MSDPTTDEKESRVARWIATTGWAAILVIAAGVIGAYVWMSINHPPAPDGLKELALLFAGALIGSMTKLIEGFTK